MMYDFFKKIIYLILNCLSAVVRLFIKQPRVAILMYHSIGNRQILFTVSWEDFVRQLDFLKKHNYQVIFLSQLVDKLIKHEKLADKTIVLTFDDGYCDNYINAWPILRQYNFPATIFLPTDYLGRQINNSLNLPLEVMSNEQIKEMSDSGLVEFGSHTHTHPRLMDISEQDFIKEAEVSKQIIEKITGKACRLFAYPRGHFSEALFLGLKGLGYDAACSVKEGLIGAKDNLFLLKRNFVYSSGGFAQFKGKLTYSVIYYNWLKKFLIFKRSSLK